MKPMRYKNYAAHIEYSDDDKSFIGHIAGIKDIVGFHGANVAELRQAFEDAVDDYLEACAAVGKEPQRPFSGRIMLRIPPEVHAHAVMQAEAHGISLNQWAAKRLAGE